MIDIPGSYTTNMFGYMEDITPSADNMRKFLDIFADFGFLPSTIQELAPSGPVLRLRFSSPDNEWSINFLLDHINITKNTTKPKGGNLGSVEDYISTATDIIGRILIAFPKKSNRLAILTNGLLKELPEEAMLQIYNKIFTPNEFYKTHPSIEWNARWVARHNIAIQGNNEELNLITSIRRMQGQLLDINGLVPMDRIEISFDINTFQGNMEQRYGIESIKMLCSEFITLRYMLINELKESLNVK